MLQESLISQLLIFFLFLGLFEKKKKKQPQFVVQNAGRIFSHKVKYFAIHLTPNDISKLQLGL